MPKIAPEKMTPEQELALKLFKEYREKSIEMSSRYKEEPVLLSRMTILALTRLAAIIAIDVGMQKEQFAGVNNLQFDEAFQQAPKFGE